MAVGVGDLSWLFGLSMALGAFVAGLVVRAVGIIRAGSEKGDLVAGEHPV